MDRTERIYNREFLNTLDPNVSDASLFLHRVFVKQDESSIYQRQRLEKVLELADRHSQLSLDTISRLKSTDSRTFWGKLNELRVASIFDLNGLRLQFNPKGPHGREGEFLVELAPEKQVFVEVKTMFPDSPNQAEERYLRKLCRAARRVQFPAKIAINLLEHPRTDFRTTGFIQFLQRTLPELASRPQLVARSAVYSDHKSGLQVLIIYMGRIHGVVTAPDETAVVMYGNDVRHIKASLRKASEQVPQDVPTVVILCDKLRSAPEPGDFFHALYGTTFWHRTGVGTFTLVCLKDGLFSRCNNSRISAIGFLASPDASDSSLDFYHHPCPRYPLEPNDLLTLSKRQWRAQITEDALTVECVHPPRDQLLRDLEDGAMLATYIWHRARIIRFHPA